MNETIKAEVLQLLKEIRGMSESMFDENDRLRAELARCHSTIKSAKTHLEMQDVDALGFDNDTGHSYLLEMISHFENLL